LEKVGTRSGFSARILLMFAEVKALTRLAEWLKLVRFPN
jgi:hypothetical protein